MRNLNLASVEEIKEYKTVTPGGYVCGITKVEDLTDKEYIKVEYDIAEGDNKNYYRELFDSKGFWGGKFIKSYKEKALPFFKAFITAVTKSNKGFVWNDDEKTLVRKLVGLVLAEEEYQANDGSIKNRLYVAQVHSVDKIRSGDFIVPALKLMNGSAKPAATNTQGFAEVSEEEDEDLPF